MDAGASEQVPRTGTHTVVQPYAEKKIGTFALLLLYNRSSVRSILVLVLPI